MFAGPRDDRRTWWVVCALVFLSAACWALATPLMTGPDEGSQARRAAAAARGQWNGIPRDEDPPIFVDVSVPVMYGDPTDIQGRCFLGPPLDRSPQEPWLPHDALATDCPVLPSDRTLVETHTNQGRGQPFFYVMAGSPSLVDPGPKGAYGSRLVVAAVTAALVASSARSIGASRRPRLAGLGLLATLTPVVVYLAGNTNAASIEIAAAVSAWAAGSLLATGSAPGSERRLIVRTGVALCVLVLSRGLSPVFGGLIVVSLAFIAGWPRCRTLLRERSAQVAALAVIAATAASGAWLLHIRSTFPPPEQVGRGWAAAAGDLGWFLHQCIGVFGNNEVELPVAMSGLWVVMALAVAVAGMVACISGSIRLPRAALVGAGALVGGAALCVTADGLNLPSIGFFWQGRYALPLMAGGLVVATFSADGGAGDDGWPQHRTVQAMRVGVVAIVAVVHLWAFLVVVRHHGGMGSGSVGVADALFDTAWDPPVPIWLALLIYVSAITLLGLLLTGGSDSSPAPRQPAPTPSAAALETSSADS